MKNPAGNKPARAIAPDLAKALGVRRANRLKSVVKYTGLPAEVLMDLAIELLDIASRKLSPAPMTRAAVGLGAARWRNVSPEERSELLRRVLQARWGETASRRELVQADPPTYALVLLGAVRDRIRAYV
jgi:hypothetical protein